MPAATPQPRRPSVVTPYEADILPGTATRLTAVYRYLLAGTREKLRARNPRLVAELASQQSRILLAELAEGFRKSTWAFRAESPGPEAGAWLRAAAFLDGSVSGGCPPPGAPGQLRPWGSR